MKAVDWNRVFFAVHGAGRVQRSVYGRSAAPVKGDKGFTLIEVVMTMVLLSVGLMSLAPLMLSVVSGNRFAQDMTLATALAEDRLEEVLHYPNFNWIVEGNFPDEAQGEIRNGDPKYAKFARTVAVIDSMDTLGRCVLKSVTVTVMWTGLSQYGDQLRVQLHGRVARF